MSEGNGNDIEIVNDIAKAEAAADKMPEVDGKPGNVIELAFDPKTQDVSITFDNSVYKTWEFLIAVLDMAKAKAQHMQKMTLAANMQRSAMAQAQNAAIAQKLKMGR